MNNIETIQERQKRIAEEVRKVLRQAPGSLGMYAPGYTNPVVINPPWPKELSLESEVE